LLLQADVAPLKYFLWICYWARSPA